MKQARLWALVLAGSLLLLPLRSAARADTAQPSAGAATGEVQRLGASAVLAQAQGGKPKAVELACAAADLDATMDKHPAAPAEALPARELLADLLLDMREPTAALQEYELSLKVDPNWFRSLIGKARAAKQAGDLATSRQTYEKLLVLTGRADGDRPELAEAISGR